MSLFITQLYAHYFKKNYCKNFLHFACLGKIQVVEPKMAILNDSEIVQSNKNDKFSIEKWYKKLKDVYKNKKQFNMHNIII